MREVRLSTTDSKRYNVVTRRHNHYLAPGRNVSNRGCRVGGERLRGITLGVSSTRGGMTNADLVDQRPEAIGPAITKKGTKIVVDGFGSRTR